ncbi:unnamed protein product [Phaedon cochleariae]|uniref:Uncharacterized protein n=1 Tax=Phaedon cochleariae TaxID=80249 RepID=A0A9P0GX50_PHACE|nr:unnamed protein product [Phaedon cochleariae]
MNPSQKLLPLFTIFKRQLASKGTPGTTKRQNRIKNLQKRYQIDDGEPVWRKSVGDKLLYQLSWGLVLFGVGCSLYTCLYTISYEQHFKGTD